MIVELDFFIKQLPLICDNLFAFSRQHRAIIQMCYLNFNLMGWELDMQSKKQLGFIIETVANENMEKCLTQDHLETKLALNTAYYGLMRLQQIECSSQARAD